MPIRYRTYARLGRNVRRRVGMYARRPAATLVRRGLMRRAAMYAAPVALAAGGYMAARAIMRRRRKVRRARRIASSPYRNIRNGIYGRGDQFNLATMTRGILAINELNFADAPGTNDNLRASPQMNYFLRGFQMTARYENLETLPIVIHHAIVQPKHMYGDISALKLDAPNELFSNPNSNSDRNIGFDPQTVNWNSEQDNMGINPAKWNVIFHKRVVLGPKIGLGNGYPSYYKLTKQYFKVNKTFAFEGSASTSVQKPLVELTWCEGFSQDILAVNPTFCKMQSHYIGIVKS